MANKWATKRVTLTQDDYEQALVEVRKLMPLAIKMGKEIACAPCKEEWYTCDNAQDNYIKEALREIQRKFLSDGKYIAKSLGQCAMARWQKVVQCSQNKRITHDKATSSANVSPNIKQSSNVEI